MKLLVQMSKIAMPHNLSYRPGWSNDVRNPHISQLAVASFAKVSGYENFEFKGSFLSAAPAKSLDPSASLSAVLFAILGELRSERRSHYLSESDLASLLDVWT
jgi:hypothetical protein